jgi:hypothetical protein
MCSMPIRLNSSNDRRVRLATRSADCVCQHGHDRSVHAIGPNKQEPPLDPPIADRAPNSDVLTDYDREHLITYLRLLDAEADGADWTDVARVVLRIDPLREPERARGTWESHLRTPSG